MRELRPLTNQDRILILSPHPDDESLSTGGLIQVAIQAGADIRVIYASNGDNNPWPQRVMERRFRIGESDRVRWGTRRQAEAIEALGHLGLKREENAEFFGFPDQGFHGAVLNLDDEPLIALKRELEDFRPTLLVYPSLHDQHPDHNSLAVFVCYALQQAHIPVERLVYLVHTNGRTPLTSKIVLKLTPEQQQRKREAIAKHATQMFLSSSRLLRYAEPVETFYKPVPPEADHAHHPVGSAHLADGHIHVRIPAKETPKFPSKLFIAMESFSQGGVRWTLPVPRSSGSVEVRNTVSGAVECEASADLTDRELHIQIPISRLKPLDNLFIKLKAPTLFFDKVGWREVSVSPNPDREEILSMEAVNCLTATSKLSRAWMLFSLLTLVWLGVILTQNIERPWVNFLDYNGAVWSQAAHNILRAGIVPTEGASTGFYFGPLPIPPAGYYLHHPPLLHLILTGGFALFGEHEWVARLLPISCSIISGIFLWLLVRSCAGTRAAALSLGIFACLPMELRYGRMVNFEPLLLMLILGALVSLRQWQVSRKTSWKILATGFLLLGMWVDWAMYLFVIVLCVYWLVCPRLKMKRMAFALFASVLVCAGLYLLRIQMLRPDALQSLTHAFVTRIGSEGSLHFTEDQWVHKITLTMLTHFLPVGLFLSLAGGIAIFRKRHSDEGLGWLGWASMMVVAMDLIFVVGFQNDSFIHEYIAFYLIAPVAILGGVALNEVTKWMERHFSKSSAFGVICAGTPFLMLLTGGYLGLKQTNALQRQFLVLDFKTSEPQDFIPKLGGIIRENFDPETYVICNFLPVYGPHLGYYAQRNLLNNITEYRYWEKFLTSPLKQNLGGVVWMNSDKAKEILAKLPPGKRHYFKIGTESFCIWKLSPPIQQKLTAKL